MPSRQGLNRRGPRWWSPFRRVQAWNEELFEDLDERNGGDEWESIARAWAYHPNELKLDKGERKANEEGPGRVWNAISWAALLSGELSAQQGYWRKCQK